jgi:hypothetical protein
MGVPVGFQILRVPDVLSWRNGRERACVQTFGNMEELLSTWIASAVGETVEIGCPVLEERTGERPDLYSLSFLENFHDVQKKRGWRLRWDNVYCFINHSDTIQPSLIRDAIISSP